MFGIALRLGAGLACPCFIPVIDAMTPCVALEHPGTPLVCGSCSTAPCRPNSHLLHRRDRHLPSFSPLAREGALAPVPVACDSGVWLTPLRAMLMRNRDHARELEQLAMAGSQCCLTRTPPRTPKCSRNSTQRPPPGASRVLVRTVPGRQPESNWRTDPEPARRLSCVPAVPWTSLVAPKLPNVLGESVGGRPLAQRHNA